MRLCSVAFPYTPTAFILSASSEAAPTLGLAFTASEFAAVAAATALIATLATASEFATVSSSSLSPFLMRASSVAFPYTSTAFILSASSEAASTLALAFTASEFAAVAAATALIATLATASEFATVSSSSLSPFLMRASSVAFPYTSTACILSASAEAAPTLGLAFTASEFAAVAAAAAATVAAAAVAATTAFIATLATASGFATVSSSSLPPFLMRASSVAFPYTPTAFILSASAEAAPTLGLAFTASEFATVAAAAALIATLATASEFATVSSSSLPPFLMRASSVAFPYTPTAFILSASAEAAPTLGLAFTASEFATVAAAAAATVAAAAVAAATAFIATVAAASEFATVSSSSLPPFLMRASSVAFPYTSTAFILSASAEAAPTLGLAFTASEFATVAAAAAATVAAAAVAAATAFIATLATASEFATVSSSSLPPFLMRLCSVPFPYTPTAFTPSASTEAAPTLGLAFPTPSASPTLGLAFPTPSASPTFPRHPSPTFPRHPSPSRSYAIRRRHGHSVDDHSKLAQLQSHHVLLRRGSDLTSGPQSHSNTDPRDVLGDTSFGSAGCLGDAAPRAEFLDLHDLGHAFCVAGAHHNVQKGTNGDRSSVDYVRLRRGDPLRYPEDSRDDWVLRPSDTRSLCKVQAPWVDQSGDLRTHRKCSRVHDRRPRRNIGDLSPLQFQLPDHRHSQVRRSRPGGPAKVCHRIRPRRQRTALVVGRSSSPFRSWWLGRSQRTQPYLLCSPLGARHPVRRANARRHLPPPATPAHQGKLFHPRLVGRPWYLGSPLQHSVGSVACGIRGCRARHQTARHELPPNLEAVVGRRHPCRVQAIHHLRARQRLGSQRDSQTRIQFRIGEPPVASGSRYAQARRHHFRGPSQCQ